VKIVKIMLAKYVFYSQLQCQLQSRHDSGHWYYITSSQHQHRLSHFTCMSTCARE